MTVLSRRRFLATSAASAAAAGTCQPALPASSEFDVAIIGAGAAGIAAARRCAATRARVTIIEGADRIGGRCVTDTTTFGTPFDRGAQWLAAPDVNPVVPLAMKSGLDMVSASSSQRVRIGKRYARTGEMEDFLTTSVRASRAITDAGRKQDAAAATAVPNDLGDWQSTIEFMLGPFSYGRDLADLSTADLARSAERDNGLFCRQGLGTLIAKLADGLPVQLSSPVLKIDWSERNKIEIKTAKGYVYARTVIVTVSTGVLAAGRLAFDPELPKRHIEAIDKLRLGSRDRIVLELPGNPLGLQQDELVYERVLSDHTAAILANIYGSTLCTVEIGGKFGASLAAAGEPAMVAFALDWLTGLYGADVRKAVRKTTATRWNHDPWTLGAASAAVPGGQWARPALAEPVKDRIFFAGEATHETLWGTVGGAWASGERAADAALKKLGLVAEPDEPKRRSSRTSHRRRK
jgi:monoamine oxidase